MPGGRERNLATGGPAVALALVLIASISVGICARPAGAESAPDESLTAALLSQGIPQNRIRGADAEGIPIVCGTDNLEPVPGARTPRPPASGVPAARTPIPNHTVGWEVIPGVIRNDGIDTFRLEVSVSSLVNRVLLEYIPSQLVAPGPAPLELFDDGLGEDQAAGDSVYTAGPFSYDPARPIADFFLHDPGGPSGLDLVGVGRIKFEEIGGGTSQFLLDPEVGLLRSDIPATQSAQHSADILSSAHVINVQTDSRDGQRFMRYLGGNLSNLSHAVYEVIPDIVDFMLVFTTYKLEHQERTSSPNFIAAIHSVVQTNFTGSSRILRDNSASYGSAGRLQSMNILDAYARGISSDNAAHEITHQWACWVGWTLPVCEGAHYYPRTNGASLVGGFQWLDNGDGTFTANCDEGRNGAHHAPPLDKYMAGLIEGSAVPPIHIYDSSLSVLDKCDGEPIVPDDLVGTTVIEDIQALYGVRTPSVAEAQKDFRIAFVAETNGRLMNPTELTFYEILAAHATADLAPEDPDPYLGFNWVPMGRFFGEGTTWSSDLCITDDDADTVCDVLDICDGSDDTVDSDSDGVPDGCDQCPGEDDSEDADDDDIPDACDDCPTDPYNDADGDTLCADADNCPLDSNLLQEDADDDGVGDACDACPGFDDGLDADSDGAPDDCDLCTNVGGVQNMTIGPKVALKKINADAVVGNDQLRASGSFVLNSESGFGGLDPVADGARVVVTATDGTSRVDVTIPGGAFDGSTGWKVSGPGSKYFYVDKSRPPVNNGLRKILIKDQNDKNPGQVGIKIKAKEGNYPVVSGDEPIQLLVVLGASQSSLGGECGETVFSAGDCRFVAADKKLTCRQ